MKLKKYLTENILPDMFYNLDHIKDEVKFLKDCISKSYKVKADELDCNVSWARKPTKLSVKDILKISANKDNFSHYTFIVRRIVFGKEKPYIEAGIRTGIPGSVDYFLWIYIKLEKLDYFIKKYKLERL